MTANPTRLTAPTLLAVHALLATHPQQPKGRELAAMVRAAYLETEPTETNPKETER